MSANPNHPAFFKGVGNYIDDAIVNGSNYIYQFSDQELRYLFFNDLQSPIRSNSVSNRPGTWEQNGVTYEVNNYGFRNEHFTEKKPLIIAGCSHTYGIGMHIEFTWGDLLSKKLNMEYVNLGFPGASTSLIVKNIFAYIKKFGNPEMIVCNFPNMERIELPINRDILIAENTKNFMDKKEMPTLGEFYLDVDYPDEGPRPLFSKKPHKIKDIIPMDIPYWLSMQSINMLEQYCEMANIKLFWSTWEFRTYQSIEKMHNIDNSYFKNKLDIKMEHWVNSNNGPDLYHENPVSGDDNCLDGKDCSNLVECHLELKRQTLDLFDIGSDLNHWGSHRHAHIFESFYNHIEKTL